jgi:phosphoserine phosphatase
VHDFWDEHRKNIAPWYLEQKRADDVIISASPEFLLRPISEELGVRLIATDMEPYTGRIRGRNCHDQEKVRRLRAAFPGETVEAFYSDSLSDTPMAEIAQHAFLVKGDQRIPWPFN